MRSAPGTLESPEQLGVEWYAAYVKHQHEAKAEEQLKRKGVEVFLPRQKVVRRWADRNKTLLTPLFPGYLFVRSDLSNKLQILSTPGIFFIVENAGHACVIPKSEIDSIRKVIESGVQARVHPFVSSGDKVRILYGPLSDITGILTRFKNQCRVVLAVEALQKAVSVEVDLDNVERVTEGNVARAASRN
jgi:transcriptional antiterminator NusG